jgi:hypothetical protein
MHMGITYHIWTSEFPFLFLRDDRQLSMEAVAWFHTYGVVAPLEYLHLECKIRIELCA